jgi:uncharacterized protein YbaP (TraB family)
MGRIRRAAGIAAAILLGWLGTAGTAAAAPAMWQVSDGDSRIYLFGALHALSPAARWRTPLYDRALAEAGAVWFEADMGAGDAAAVQGLLQRYGFDAETPLSRKLAPADLGALSRHVDVRRIDHLRPWAAALMLSMQPALSRGASVEAGADMTIIRVARAETKTIRTFETLEDQARMYAGLPKDAELRYLTDTIKERSQPPRLAVTSAARSLEATWLAGDLARLGPRLVGQMKAGNPALYDALLKRRNLAWVDKLAGALEGSGVELVNVGALHMVGDDGLPALLAARGFRVERLQ